LKEAGIEDVEKAGEIRVGNAGEICAILKVGETKLTTVEERRAPEVEVRLTRSDRSDM
jgi:hypothetical protein